ncbi:MAG: hypothetical protein RL662_926 [Bacteroidota bacterium]|jgi:DNA-binding response OmpR family regulator
MRKHRILWVDDEIDLLKPHILFLEEKGYEIVTANSGLDALDNCNEEVFDLIFLDENMPGLTGLQTLVRIKEIQPETPTIMITKSEDEGIMTEAIGKKIADYLIKPVNPNQILLSIKRNLHKNDIETEAAVEGYREEFSKINVQINQASSFDEWVDIYKRLVYWEMELTATQNPLLELNTAQKLDANNTFVKFIKKNYTSWIQQPDTRPLMSPDLFKKKIFPKLDNGEKLFLIVIDNFRFDQWWAIKDMLSADFTFDEDMYMSILPTATQYARNAIFSGLMPLQIKEMYPHLWTEETEEEGKNLHEQALLQTQIDRFRKSYTFSYDKIHTSTYGNRYVQQIKSLANNQLNVVVINFVDMLSHARTDSQMIRELAANEAAYRSLTRSWFQHSSISSLLKQLASMGYNIVLTTDHGTIRVKNALKVFADKSTSTNLRYKVGKNLDYDYRKVYETRNPSEIGLPSPNLSSKYIFAQNEDFFAYPNNYNHYVSYYADTFQHGGISIEEMLVPLITLNPK